MAIAHGWLKRGLMLLAGTAGAPFVVLRAIGAVLCAGGTVRSGTRIIDSIDSTSFAQANSDSITNTLLEPIESALNLRTKSLRAVRVTSPPPGDETKRFSALCLAFSDAALNNFCYGTPTLSSAVSKDKHGVLHKATWRGRDAEVKVLHPRCESASAVIGADPHDAVRRDLEDVLVKLYADNLAGTHEVPAITMDGGHFQLISFTDASADTTSSATTVD
jgi:hypothetical protein